ncbi:MAG: hypothetical protein ACI9NT_000979 [Bacteroidia bacterium]|jgi:hypothetical protein
MLTSNCNSISIAWKALALLFPLMVGCGGSELVNIELPSAITVGEAFEVTVDHVINDDFQPVSDINASLVFAAIVPESWQATSAEYAAVIDGSAVSLPVIISSAPPESSPEFVELVLDEVSNGDDVGDLTCDATITLREGPDNTSLLIATLFSATSSEDFEPRTASAFSLAAYADSAVFLVSDVGSCLEPNGLIVDNLVLSVGSGNLLANPSFESNFDSWDLSASGPVCVNEVLGDGDSTDGAGAWTIPLPTDGALLYASDANNPGQCIMSQEINIPPGAGAATLTGDIGASVGGSIALFLDMELPDLPADTKLIWLRTADIADFSDFEPGDLGTLSVLFTADEASEEEQEVIFLHGYYSELPENTVKRASSTPGATMRQLASVGSQGGGSVVAPAANPGFIGAGIWFTDLSDGPTSFPQTIADSILIIQSLSAGTREIPALSGMMLIFLSLGLAFIGIRHKKQRVK